MEGVERGHEVGAVDVVADLLTVVAEDRVRLAGHRAPHQVGEEPVELAPAWLGPVRQPPRKHTVGMSK